MADALNDLNMKVNALLLEEMWELLKDLKAHRGDIAFKERAMIMVYIMRCQSGFMGMRKDEQPDGQGDAVRKYSKAFTANATRGRKTGTGLSVAALHDDDDEPAL